MRTVILKPLRFCRVLAAWFQDNQGREGEWLQEVLWRSADQLAWTMQDRGGRGHWKARGQTKVKIGGLILPAKNKGRDATLSFS